MELHYVKTLDEEGYKIDDFYFNNKMDLENFLKFNKNANYEQTYLCEDINDCLNTIEIKMNEINNIKKEIKDYLESNNFYVKYIGADEGTQTVDVGKVSYDRDMNELVFDGNKLWNSSVQRFIEHHQSLEFKDDKEELFKLRKDKVVYFIGDEINRVVKIGYSSNVYERYKALQTGYPRKLDVFGVIKGTESLEKKLHKKFDNYRLNGEWFELTEDLVEFINLNAS